MKRYRLVNEHDPNWSEYLEATNLEDAYEEVIMANLGWIIVEEEETDSDKDEA